MVTKRQFYKRAFISNGSFLSRVSDARNKTIPMQARLSEIILLGEEKPEHALEDLLAIIYDRDDDIQARTHAVQALAKLDKRTVFPVMLDLLEPSAEYALRCQAAASAYLLHDTRVLFPLVNLFNRLDPAQEHDRSLGCRILESLREMADPRAAEFLGRVRRSGTGTTARLAGEAYDRSIANDRVLYTFIGDEQARKAAEELDLVHTKHVRKPEDLCAPEVQEWLRSERPGAPNAIYVVRPAEAGKPFSGALELIIAPRRTEHYLVARGSDVLAAGQLLIDPDTLRVLGADNHSGGYLCAPNSFTWLRAAARHAGVRFDLEEFSALYPKDGYCADDFLSQFRFHPAYRP